MNVYFKNLVVRPLQVVCSGKTKHSVDFTHST